MNELTETIRIRVSAPDRRAMEAAAKRAKLNLSAWARMILSHYARGAEIATAVEDNMKAVGFPRRPSRETVSASSYPKPGSQAENNTGSL